MIILIIVLALHRDRIPWVFQVFFFFHRLYYKSVEIVLSSLGRFYSFQNRILDALMH